MAAERGFDQPEDFHGLGVGGAGLDQIKEPIQHRPGFG